MEKAPEVSEHDVVVAYQRIKGSIHHTPIMTSVTVNRLVGRDVRFKCENLQRTGSYKIRGAANHVLAQRESRSALIGVVAASSGNHGQAVACMARDVGIPAVIVVPTTITPAKKAALLEYGAVVVDAPPAGDAIYVEARRIADENGYLEIPPFDHPMTIAGQGTCVFEALAEVGEVEAVLCPIGGGGLAAGTILGVSAAGSAARVYAVEPAQADDTARSFRSGSRVALASVDTIADALMSPIPGELTFAINRVGLSDVFTVSEREIVAATRLIWERMKLVIEPSAAVPVAGLINGSVSGDGPVLVVLSGGNTQFPTDQTHGVSNHHPAFRLE
jgi:threonine dehydratase